MLEHYRQPLLPREKFYLRMLRSIAVATLLLFATVLTGAATFRYLEHFSWIDAVLNCLLIMTGVGTVGVVNTSAGKIFTGIYSLISTLIFFTILAIIFTPLLHRLLHRFHLDLEKKD